MPLMIWTHIPLDKDGKISFSYVYKYDILRDLPFNIFSEASYSIKVSIGSENDHHQNQ